MPEQPEKPVGTSFGDALTRIATERATPPVVSPAEQKREPLGPLPPLKELTPRGNDPLQQSLPRRIGARVKRWFSPPPGIQPIAEPMFPGTMGDPTTPPIPKNVNSTSRR